MLQEIQKELTEHIIPFWRGLRDDEYGGYYGLMDFDLKVDKKAEKGAILNSRILWFFSRAFNELKDISLLEEADHAYRFLKDKLAGDGTKGICWSVTYDGKVLPDPDWDAILAGCAGTMTVILRLLMKTLTFFPTTSSPRTELWLKEP